MNRSNPLQHPNAYGRYSGMTTSQTPGPGAQPYAAQQPYIPQQAGPYGYQQIPPMPPAAAPTKRPARWPWIVGIIGAFILGLAIGGSGGSTSTPSTPSAAPASTQQQAPAAAAPSSVAVAPVTPIGPATEVSDGTYQVGTDMVPGRYKTAGPPADATMPMCYFARSKDDSGELGSIIANDIAQGPSSVTVKAGEFVKLSGGCTWTKQ